MKISDTAANRIATVISYSFIILFVYASVSKLLDFQNFRIQIAQSPLLSAFAGFVSVAVIILELLISVLLAIPTMRRWALIGAFAMMSLFTIYIFIILNYSPYVPCSCGGILENMGWQQHMYFNMVFVLLAAWGCYLLTNLGHHNAFSLPVYLASTLALCLITMTALFIASEDIVQNDNNFVRRFPPFPAKRYKALDLKFNSYYFAGENNGKIYLGNRTAPALITIIDTALSKIEKVHISFADTLYNFKNIQLRIDAPHFFIYDGTARCIYTGKLNNPKAVLQSRKIPAFMKAVVIDSTSMIIRGINKQSQNVLATLKINDSAAGKVHPEILQKQIDGFFDTDGTMHYSSQYDAFVYTYYYRNQYTVTNRHLNLRSRGHTIDTTTKAKIKIEYIKGKRRHGFSAPPKMVNRLSAVNGPLLFINSTLQGKYDRPAMRSKANIVDVYNYVSNKYLMSFYVYKMDGNEIDDMMATRTHFFILSGNKLVSYRFGKALHKEINNK